jgi:RND family efflux transporter MFP subunit
VIAALTAWRIHVSKAPEKKQAPALVFKSTELTWASPLALGQSVELSGSVQAPDHVTIKAKAAGLLKSLNVTEGQWVHKGETIGMLDLTELQSRLAERRAALAAAKTLMTQASIQWDANQRLAERGFLAPTAIESSRANLESAKAQVQAAESALQTVQVQLRDADLVAPIGGWVQKRLALEGEKLATEQPIVSILSTDRLEIHTQITALDAQRLAIGRVQDFNIDGIDTPVKAQLSRMLANADMNSRSITLVWLIRTPIAFTLRPGQFALAAIDLPGLQERLTLPVESIRQEGGQSVAWIIHEGKLQRKALITGRRSPDGHRVEILDGLDASHRVLAVRFDGLRDGQEANISTADDPDNAAPRPAPATRPIAGSAPKS